MGRKLRRYRFSGIERLTKDRVRVRNALLHFLPQTPFEHGFKAKIREVIEPLVHADIDLWFDHMKDVAAGDLGRELGSAICVAVIGLSPKEHKVLIEVDLTIAQHAVERTLGGATEDVDGTRPLSEIEEGVYAFLLLKVLKLAQQDYGSPHQLALKLDGLAGDLETLQSRVDVNQAWIAMNFKLFFDVAVGYCRIYLPRSLVETDFSVALNPEPGPALSRWLGAVAKNVGRVAALKSELVIEVGQIGLTVDDLEALEEEDIILVENPDVQMGMETEGALGGRVACHIGAGHAGLIHGTLMVGETGKYEVAIDDILTVGVPKANGSLGAGDLASEDGEQAMEQALDHEQAKALSASLGGVGSGVGGGLGEGVSQALRERAAERAASGQLSPLPRTAQAAGEPGAEHAEGEVEEEAEEEGGYDDEELLPEAVGLLEDVSVPMVVELGRVEVSAADIVGLRPGQVIELSRAPGDAVDLVVDNRRIGKGELVEIEGELGVRILSLAK